MERFCLTNLLAPNLAVEEDVSSEKHGIQGPMLLNQDSCGTSLPRIHHPISVVSLMQQFHETALSCNLVSS